MAPSPPPPSEENGLAAGMGGQCATLDQESDANFFKVISENLKYAFNSPLPNTQFPTPYSSNQLQMSQNANQGPQPSAVENSSSLIENSMLPGMTGAGNMPSGEPLNDFNMQPSSVLQNCNPFPNEFLLASPEQFKEFLLESPAGFSFLHKTPAKTPLRFVSGSMKNDENNGDLFGNPTISSSHGKEGSGNKFAQTPLRSIDLNLMFNSNQMAPASSSPSKRVALSLTPYGRKVLNEIRTPYAKALASSNSALADFQRARKDFNKLHSSPPTAKKMVKTPQSKLHVKSNTGSFPSTVKNSGHHTLPRDNLHLYSGIQGAEDGDVCGSSPTTIQLNSSITKSTTRLNASTIPIMTREISESNVDERLFNEDVESLQLSPTPKCNTLSSMDTLRIPELPKMGSFKSETPPLSLNTATGKKAKATASASSSSRNGKVKKTTKKQPKFQIIVANAQKFNVPTSQKGTKKASLKRSQSLLAEAPANWTSNGSVQNNNTSNTKSTENDTRGGKRSRSFAEKK